MTAQPLHLHWCAQFACFIMTCCNVPLSLDQHSIPRLVFMFFSLIDFGFGVGATSLSMFTEHGLRKGGKKRHNCHRHEVLYASTWKATEVLIVVVLVVKLFPASNFAVDGCTIPLTGQ